MSKLTQPRQAMVFCGIDVSAATLAVAVQQENQRFEERVFDNTASGHQALIGWLRKAKVPAELHIYEKGGHGVGLAPKDPRRTAFEVYAWLGAVQESLVRALAR